MESFILGASQVPAASPNPNQPVARSADSQFRPDATVGVSRSDKLIKSRDVKSARRLISDQQYFGLEAGVLRAGAKRALARVTGRTSEECIDVRSLGEDFRLEGAAGAALLSAFLAGGMLYPDGIGRYRPTRLFREYALATVVAPLARERAKALVDRACALAASVNADWDNVPFQIEMVAVSGSYMSRRELLPELSFSLVLCPRAESRRPRPSSMLSEDEGLRRVLDAMRALSSFIAVRIAVDRTGVQRPFSVVFQIDQNLMDARAGGWDRFREWSASVTRWLAVK
ncbi:MAG TPA: hypothetical protein VFH33_04770 [Candidatus Krumholzibacteria bacterium]|nr:hypothetical protein [Candidatus Krumholzibacteria bacterium]